MSTSHAERAPRAGRAPGAAARRDPRALTARGSGQRAYERVRVGKADAQLADADRDAVEAGPRRWIQVEGDGPVARRAHRPPAPPAVDAHGRGVTAGAGRRDRAPGDARPE